MNSKNKEIWRFIAAIFAIFALVAFSATASAAIIDVPSPGNETIQQAINNASAGDTILVNATAYNAQGIAETIIVNKSDIIIRSVSGRAVVSAGGASEHVFDITDQTNVTLQGFEIRDAHGTTKDVAGIYMNNASECNISDNIVTDISTPVWSFKNAYGIYLDDSSDNSFGSSTSVCNLSADMSAYGIYLDSSSNNTFSSSTSVYNLYGDWDAYGIRLDSSSNNTFSSSTSVYNLSSEMAASGIYLGYSSNNTFSSSTSVCNLSAYWDAFGISLEDNSDDNECHDCTISNITAAGTTDAYGVYIISGSDNNSLLDGEIRDNDHGIWIDNSDNNTIVRNMIVNNTAHTGVHLNETANYTEIHENCFYDNVPQAMDNGTDNNWTGNYWSPPPGGPSDYSIPGAAGSKDNDPLPYCPLKKPQAPAQVPALTPIGMIALVGLLSVIAAISIRKRRKK